MEQNYWIRMPKPIKPDNDFELQCPKCHGWGFFDDNFCAEC